MAPVDEIKQDDLAEDEPIVKELKLLDDEYLKLEREFEAEERALKAKFLERQNPLLKERAEILADASQAQEDAKKIGTPALRGFWQQAILNHPAFKEDDNTVKEWDEPVLDYLKDVTFEMVDAPEDETHQSFRLDFMFAENPCFEETLLSKTYIVRETSPWNGETEVKEIKSTKITWKAGQDVTVAITKKKVKGGGAKKAKQAKEKLEPRHSFFRTFLNVNLTEGGGVPEGLEPLAEDIKEQAGEDGPDFGEDESIVGFMMERDFELGSAIKDNIIPYAVRWYTGEACPDDESDDDGEESEEEDDDDEDDDDDSEEEEKPKAKAKPKSKGTKPAAGGEAGKKEEECKQQ